MKDFQNKPNNLFNLFQIFYPSNPNFFNSSSLYLKLFIKHYSYFNFNEIQITSEFPSAKAIFNNKHDMIWAP